MDASDQHIHMDSSNKEEPMECSDCDSNTQLECSKENKDQAAHMLSSSASRHTPDGNRQIRNNLAKCKLYKLCSILFNEQLLVVFMDVKETFFVSCSSQKCTIVLNNLEKLTGYPERQEHMHECSAVEEATFSDVFRVVPRGSLLVSFDFILNNFDELWGNVNADHRNAQENNISHCKYLQRETGRHSSSFFPPISTTANQKSGNGMVTRYSKRNIETPTCETPPLPRLVLEQSDGHGGRDTVYYVPACVLCRLYPAMIDFLQVISREFCEGGAMELEDDMQPACCSSVLQARQMTRTMFRQNGWGGSWSHVTSRDVLVHWGMFSRKLAEMREGGLIGIDDFPDGKADGQRKKELSAAKLLDSDNFMHASRQFTELVTDDRIRLPPIHRNNQESMHKTEKESTKPVKHHHSSKKKNRREKKADPLLSVSNTKEGADICSDIQTGVCNSPVTQSRNIFEAMLTPSQHDSGSSCAQNYDKIKKKPRKKHRKHSVETAVSGISSSLIPKANSDDLSKAMIESKRKPKRVKKNAKQSTNSQNSDLHFVPKAHSDDLFRTSRSEAKNSCSMMETNEYFSRIQQHHKTVCIKSPEECKQVEDYQYSSDNNEDSYSDNFEQSLHVGIDESTTCSRSSMKNSRDIQEKSNKSDNTMSILPMEADESNNNLTCEIESNTQYENSKNNSALVKQVGSGNDVNSSMVIYSRTPSCRQVQLSHKTNDRYAHADLQTIITEPADAWTLLKASSDGTNTNSTDGLVQKLHMQASKIITDDISGNSKSVFVTPSDNIGREKERVDLEVVGSSQVKKKNNVKDSTSTYTGMYLPYLSERNLPFLSKSKGINTHITRSESFNNATATLDFTENALNSNNILSQNNSALKTNNTDRFTSTVRNRTVPRHQSVAPTRTLGTSSNYIPWDHPMNIQSPLQSSVSSNEQTKSQRNKDVTKVQVEDDNLQLPSHDASGLIELEEQGKEDDTGLKYSQIIENLNDMYKREPDKKKIAETVQQAMGRYENLRSQSPKISTGHGNSTSVTTCDSTLIESYNSQSMENPVLCSHSQAKFVDKLLIVASAHDSDHSHNVVSKNTIMSSLPAQVCDSRPNISTELSNLSGSFLQSVCEKCTKSMSISSQQFLTSVEGNSKTHLPVLYQHLDNNKITTTEPDIAKNIRTTKEKHVKFSKDHAVQQNCRSLFKSKSLDSCVESKSSYRQKMEEPFIPQKAAFDWSVKLSNRSVVKEVADKSDPYFLFEDRQPVQPNDLSLQQSFLANDYHGSLLSDENNDTIQIHPTHDITSIPIKPRRIVDFTDYSQTNNSKPCLVIQPTVGPSSQQQKMVIRQSLHQTEQRPLVLLNKPHQQQSLKMLNPISQPRFSMITVKYPELTVAPISHTSCEFSTQSGLTDSKVNHQPLMNTTDNQHLEKANTAMQPIHASLIGNKPSRQFNFQQVKDTNADVEVINQQHMFNNDSHQSQIFGMKTGNQKQLVLTDIQPQPVRITGQNTQLTNRVICHSEKTDIHQQEITGIANQQPNIAISSTHTTGTNSIVLIPTNLTRQHHQLLYSSGNSLTMPYLAKLCSKDIEKSQMSSMTNQQSKASSIVYPLQPQTISSGTRLQHVNSNVQGSVVASAKPMSQGEGRVLIHKGTVTQENHPLKYKTTDIFHVQPESRAIQQNGQILNLLKDAASPYQYRDATPVSVRTHLVDQFNNVQDFIRSHQTQAEKVQPVTTTTSCIAAPEITLLKSKTLNRTDSQERKSWVQDQIGLQYEETNMERSVLEKLYNNEKPHTGCSSISVDCSLSEDISNKYSTAGMTNNTENKGGFTKSTKDTKTDGFIVESESNTEQSALINVFDNFTGKNIQTTVNVSPILQIVDFVKCAQQSTGKIKDSTVKRDKQMRCFECTKNKDNTETEDKNDEILEAYLHDADISRDITTKDQSQLTMQSNNEQVISVKSPQNLESEKAQSACKSNLKLTKKKKNVKKRKKGIVGNSSSACNDKVTEKSTVIAFSCAEDQSSQVLSTDSSQKGILSHPKTDAVVKVRGNRSTAQNEVKATQPSIVGHSSKDEKMKKTKVKAKSSLKNKASTDQPDGKLRMKEEKSSTGTAENTNIIVKKPVVSIATENTMVPQKSAKKLFHKKGRRHPKQKLINKNRYLSVSQQKINEYEGEKLPEVTNTSDVLYAMQDDLNNPNKANVKLHTELDTNEIETDKVTTDEVCITEGEDLCFCVYDENQDIIIPNLPNVSDSKIENTNSEGIGSEECTNYYVFEGVDDYDNSLLRDDAFYYDQEEDENNRAFDPQETGDQCHVVCSPEDILEVVDNSDDNILIANNEKADDPVLTHNKDIPEHNNTSVVHFNEKILHNNATEVYAESDHTQNEISLPDRQSKIIYVEEFESVILDSFVSNNDQSRIESPLHCDTIDDSQSTTHEYSDNNLASGLTEQSFCDRFVHSVHQTDKICNVSTIHAINEINEQLNPSTDEVLSQSSDEVIEYVETQTCYNNKKRSKNKSNIKTGDQCLKKTSQNTMSQKLPVLKKCSRKKQLSHNKFSVTLPTIPESDLCDSKQSTPRQAAVKARLRIQKINADFISYSNCAGDNLEKPPLVCAPNINSSHKKKRKSNKKHCKNSLNKKTSDTCTTGIRRSKRNTSKDVIYCPVDDIDNDEDPFDSDQESLDPSLKIDSATNLSTSLSCESAEAGSKQHLEIDETGIYASSLGLRSEEIQVVPVMKKTNRHVKKSKEVKNNQLLSESIKSRYSKEDRQLEEYLKEQEHIYDIVKTNAAASDKSVDNKESSANEKEIEDREKEIYQPFYDDTKMSYGGLVFYKEFVFPYVLMNGYKYIALKDATTLFTGCKLECSIPRTLLQKNKSLFRTFCTWELVFQLDRIGIKRGRSLITGDILLRCDTLIQLLPELQKEAADKHMNTTLKKSQRCQYMI